MGSLESPFQRVNYSAEKLERWHGAGTSNWVPILSQGIVSIIMVLLIILKMVAISELEIYSWATILALV